MVAVWPAFAGCLCGERYGRVDGLNWRFNFVLLLFMEAWDGNGSTFYYIFGWFETSMINRCIT